VVAAVPSVQGVRLEPLLAAISSFLDQQHELIERVRRDLVRGLKKPARGRRGLTAPQVLRSLILMRLKNWDKISVTQHENMCRRNRIARVHRNVRGCSQVYSRYASLPAEPRPAFAALSRPTGNLLIGWLGVFPMKNLGWFADIQ
jgi:hypothetical protein